MNGGPLTGAELGYITSILDPAFKGNEDWFELLTKRRGYCGNERVYTRHGCPLWFLIMEHHRTLPDWHRIFATCNPNALDETGCNAYWYTSSHPEVIPRLLRAHVDPTNVSYGGHNAFSYHATRGAYNKEYLVALAVLLDYSLDYYPLSMGQSVRQAVNRARLLPTPGTILRGMYERSSERRANCKRSALELYAVLRLRASVPRDLARVFALRVWGTRHERLEWHPREEQ